MQEWLNWLAWKAGIPQKGIRGSNPLLSAEVKELIGSISSFLMYRDSNGRIAGRCCIQRFGIT
jgi:hypothetical protein